MKLGVVVAWKGTDLLGDASRLHQAFRRQEVEAELNRGLKVLAPRGGGGGGSVAEELTKNGFLRTFYEKNIVPTSKGCFFKQEITHLAISDLERASSWDKNSLTNVLFKCPRLYPCR